MSKKLPRIEYHIAQKEHHCERCDLPIFPGERYYLEISLKNGRLWFVKYHDGCPIDPDEDLYERGRHADTSRAQPLVIRKAA